MCNRIKIIDKPYHLSYPFIFKNKDDYFLIPESLSNKTIELYTCVCFPWEWEFQIDYIEAYDTTLLYHQNKWWLFTNLAENSGASVFDELFLFYSKELYTNDGAPHPLNPVVSDVRKSRPAGRIFIHEGKIIRPSQIFSRRYGYGVQMNEIKVLNENEYEEIQLHPAGING